MHMALTDISKIQLLTWSTMRHSVTERFVLASPSDATGEEGTSDQCLPGKRQVYLWLRTASSAPENLSAYSQTPGRCVTVTRNNTEIL